MPHYRKVIRTNECHKIPVRKVVKSGSLEFEINNTCLGLKMEHIGNDDWLIRLYINFQPSNLCWKTSSVPVMGKLRHNGFIPSGTETYYIHSHNGKHRRFLFLTETSIGTMDELGIRYESKCLSTKQRNTRKAEREMREKFFAEISKAREKVF